MGIVARLDARRQPVEIKRAEQRRHRPAQQAQKKDEQDGRQKRQRVVDDGAASAGNCEMPYSTASSEAVNSKRVRRAERTARPRKSGSKICLADLLAALTALANIPASRMAGAL